ncbi:MAG: alpha/beta hydrolase [Eubacteriales bacterium]|nr:alpha/beta hydrolase [Eubacteriales bacterium]
MKHEIIYLKDHYPVLGENGRNPYVTTYLPDNLAGMGRQNEKRPCIVVCPGGGYSSCSEREAEPVAVHFLPEGYNVFVLNYSCAPERYPVQLREVAGLMEMIHENAEDWHCDTSRIALMGFSAGGHLAAHYSTSHDCAEIREVFPDSKPVSLSVLCYPVITSDPEWANKNSFKRLLGDNYCETEEIATVSCNRLVTKNTPPAFIWHTSEDSGVPVMNSLLYSQALAANNIPFEMHIYPFGSHGLSTCDHTTLDNPQGAPAYDKEWIVNLKRWLKMMFSGTDNTFSKY